MREPIDLEALLERVATRERRLEALSPKLRAQEARTVARAHRWPASTPLPLGLLTEAGQALAGGHGAPRPWLTSAQVERLRRAEQRYTRYADHRPDGSPPAPAAVLIDLIEHAPREVRQPLPWAITQLDVLSKRMRREHRRHHPPELARRRAQRRCEQDTAHAGAFFRRPARKEIDVAVEHLADGIAGRRPPGKSAAAWEALEEQLHDAGELPTNTGLAAANERSRNGWHRLSIENRFHVWSELSWPGFSARRLSQLSRSLHAIGVGASPEQLRLKVRDRLLLTGADPGVLEQLKRPEQGVAYTPERYNPAAPQLTDCDRNALLERPGLARMRARAHTAAEAAV